MICREQDEAFVMVKQHEHGRIAGEIAAAFRLEQVPAGHRREEVLWAVANHDRGWIDLDETPFWNDAEGAPYSFIDFPVVPKLTFYRRGLNEIEEVTAYGALLCSKHFERLIVVSGEDTPELTAYLEDEEQRRSRIQRELEQRRPIGEEELYYDARLLQFCDDLSLYLVLNEPGSPEAAEHPWFKDGFSGSEEFGFTMGRAITAKWRNERELELDPFPFAESVQVSVTQRRVLKREIAAKGIAQAYAESPEEQVLCTLTGPVEPESGR